MVAAPQVIKYGMLAANLLVFIFGCTIFGVGTRTISNLNIVEKCTVPGTGVLYTAMKVITAAGPILAISTLIGALSAFKHIKAIVIAFWLVSLAGMVVLVAGLLLVRSSWHQLPPDFAQRVTETADICKQNPLVKQIWDATKKALQDNPAFQCVEGAVKKYTLGCLKLVRSFIVNHHTILKSLSIVACCIVIVSLILSVAIYRLRDQYNSVPQARVT